MRQDEQLKGLTHLPNRNTVKVMNTKILTHRNAQQSCQSVVLNTQARFQIAYSGSTCNKLIEVKSTVWYTLKQNLQNGRNKCNCAKSSAGQQ